MNPTASRRTVLAGIATLAGSAALPAGAATVGPAPVPSNPLVHQRADAQVFRNDDGYYYMTGSVPEYDRLVLRRSRTLAGLATAPEAILWRHLSSGPLSGFVWAPELHKVDGRWTMYFAAGPSGGGEDVFRIRTWAVVCDGSDPMTGKWTLLGQLQTPWDSFNLDSTSFVHQGKRYLCWAQREPGIDTNSNLYLAPLATPLTFAATPVRLSVPTLPWEVRGYKVNEAPSFLAHGNRVFLSYSASATDSRYCLGLLTADANADIMQAASWSKSPEPVFETSAVTGVYGPGHNSFTVDEQGGDILVYHGRDYDKITGDPLFDPNRHTRVQRLYFDADGRPDFGIPVGNGPIPSRLSPAGQPAEFLVHHGDAVAIGKGTIPATQFRLLPGRDAGSVSLQPVDAPDFRVSWRDDSTVALARDDGSRQFATKSSLTLHPALRTPDGYRLIPVGKPGAVVSHEGGRVLIGPAGDRANTIFILS
ncbi:family 43 glycosylhydrolase (plasmid) [Polymorphobacter sp. PAMC 29334]|uniref:family 43 glycosylhydrolase n=1 Tax=Polymorphobacter sp. PAMC 29334 TaxID=2862331 RepID=UPI001C7543BC|nr:family 43 glycosylhydrolase [Polymorphobacter sp. PAMC 29334]QYE33628.1 family 43 glycosylhydrolase [Polymorphobacter sp. PAMC 29334]